MPGLGVAPEPDSVSTTPTAAEEEELRVEQVNIDGQHTNIVKDQSDYIAFPGLVPQDVHSPEESRSPPSSSPSAKPDPEDTSSAAVTNNPGLTRSSTTPYRPSIDRKWKTEASNGNKGRGLSFPAAPKRAGTSYIQKSLWKENYNNWEQKGYYSSSSSSSEDDQGNEQSRKVIQNKKKQRQQQQQGHKPDQEHGRFRVGNENYSTKGKLKKDGRLRISVNETANTGYLAKALGQAVKKVVPLGQGDERAEDTQQTPADDNTLPSTLPLVDDENIVTPSLNIVIMVIGSRGDAQPFLKIGKVLKEQYGHRVRIATHPAFREFVERDSGLEFFSVGGDPSELMAFMVKNPGMIPTLDAVKAGDIGKRRSAMAEMFDGFWRACINATDDEKDIHNLKMMGDKEPFVADAIIANPPSMAHIHCAEALGVPLHLMFTFPYTPTQAFPHPLASIKKSNVDPGYTNFISYPLVEMMVWQGLGDLVNDFRTKTLQLDPLSTIWAPGQAYRLHVPFSYLWSPGLVSKPEDWGPEIDVSGFVFLDLASSFTPPDPLTEFLNAGETPIYIGFGSIVVDDPDQFTQLVFEAVKQAGCRALLSKGWGGLGGEDVPDNIFMLENTPHDWLFPRVKACVIHGGAGTVAIALKCGKPITVVPFFGDQHFWGAMLASSGAGPEPVPYKNLTAEKLAENIAYCFTKEAQSAAEEIAANIEAEGDGAENAVRAFHQHLNLAGLKSMRCSILKDRVATWRLKNSTVKLSPLAADVIIEKGYLNWRKLRLLRHTEWNDFEGPGEPLTGAASSIVGSVGRAFKGVASVPLKMHKTTRKRTEKKKKRQRIKDFRDKRRQEKHGAADENLHQHVETKNEPPAKPPTELQLDKNEKIGKPNAETSNGGTSDGKNDKKGEPTEDEKAAAERLLEKEENQEKEKDDNGQEQPQTNGANGAPKRPAPQGRLTTGTMTSMETTSTMENPVEDYAEDVGSGIGKSAQALAKAPVDFSMAVAQGFHNAPRLYGDDTVRRPPRVTGIRSGLKAAQFEFVYGIYDGATGLVRLPVRGAKKDGFVGCLKGTGMGLTGFVLKPLTAVFGPVGYTMKGIVKQAERQKQPDKVIRRARILQGQRELRKLGEERKEVADEVEHGWQTMKALWEALEQVERQKGGVKSRLGAKKRRGLHAAFESVEIAEETLDAVKKGQDVSTVVGTEKELKEIDRESESGKIRASGEGRHKSLASIEGRRSMDSKMSKDTRNRRGSADTDTGARRGPRSKRPMSNEDIPEDSEGETFEDARSELLSERPNSQKSKVTTTTT